MPEFNPQFDPTIYKNGALTDERPQEEKERDYQFSEVVASANPVKWEEKKPEQLRSFPSLNQQQQNSCVAHATRKELGIMYFVNTGTYIDFSSSHIYKRRYNRPSGGMAAIDARKIAKAGTTLEQLVPSTQYNDREVDALTIESYKEDVGAIFAVPNYVSGLRTIDDVASVIQTTGKGVHLWFFFTAREWSKEVPTFDDYLVGWGDSRALHHAVCAVDFTLKDGKKALKIEDSAHFGGISERYITEDMFNQRIYFASYLVNFKFLDQTNPPPIAPPPSLPNKPKYNWTRTFGYGSKGEDVKAFQDVCKYEGVFPINQQSTGNYFGLTQEACYKLGVKNRIAPQAELDSVKGKNVGPKMLTYLKNNYS